MNSGMYDEALRFAQEALAAHLRRKTTRSILVRTALLAAASIWAGYTDLGELEQYRLRRLTPQSDTHCLLQAYATVLADPCEAMRLLKGRHGLNGRPSGCSFVLLPTMSSDYPASTPNGWTRHCGTLSTPNSVS